MLGLRENKVFGVILGNHFEWLDILIYILAAFAIFLFELGGKRYYKNSKQDALNQIKGRMY